jgi:hypothetical protein
MRLIRIQLITYIGVLFQKNLKLVAAGARSGGKKSARLEREKSSEF